LVAGIISLFHQDLRILYMRNDILWILLLFRLSDARLGYLGIC
jgi:hypothetical protein